MMSGRTAWFLGLLVFAALGGLTSCRPEPEPVRCDCVQSGWDLELIDPAGMRPRLQVVPDGEVRVVHRDEDSLDPRLASRDPDTSQWQLQTLRSDRNVIGYVAALATEADGAPIVGLQDEPPRNLAVATRQDGEWIFETVSADGNTGWEVEIAVDEAGTAHLTWATYAEAPVEGGLHYASRPAGGDWTLEDLGMAGWAPAVAVDGMGTVHIVGVAFDPTPSSLVHLERPPAGDWRIEMIEAVRGLTPVLALDAEGGVHVVSVDSERLDYSYRAPDGTWSLEVLDERSSADPAVVVGCDGTLHVAWVDGATQAPTYARRAPGETWSVAPVQGLGGAALPSLGLGPRGGVHLAVASSEFGGLAYGRPRCD